MAALRHTLAPLADLLWCFMLTGYVLAGLKLATFHGDEAMLIYASRDYQTAFIEGKPGRLTTQPPYSVDSDAHLRILNGSVIPYSIGLSWHLRGLSAADLPSLWRWEQSYAANVAQGARPSEAMLAAGRLPSALLLCASIGMMFALAWQFGGRKLAYLTSLLYTLHPVILLNGRRAMQEGAWLCFGLLTMLIMVSIIQRQARRQPTRILWAAFVLAGGLTIASKHSGILYVLSALGWMMLAEQRQAYAKTVAQVSVSTVAMLGIFVLMSPALWSNPIARLGDLMEVREELLQMQSRAYQATSLPQRIEGIVKQPYLTPLQHYEVSFWDQAAEIQKEIDNYMASPWRGLTLGKPAAMTMTFMAGIGLLLLCSPVGWRLEMPALRVGVVFWLGIVIASLLVNPLPWQRYYLPLLPIVSLLTAIGMIGTLRLLSEMIRKVSSQASRPRNAGDVRFHVSGDF